MAHQRWSECARHLRRHGRGMVVVALLGVAACDPTGKMQVGGGDADGTDPELVGAWRNQSLFPGATDGDYTRVITTWVFNAEATCSRNTKTLLWSEGIEREQLRLCTWTADGRILSLTYEGYTDTVNYAYSFPTLHPDTLDIGGFLFSHAP